MLFAWQIFHYILFLHWKNSDPLDFFTNFRVKLHKYRYLVLAVRFWAFCQGMILVTEKGTFAWFPTMFSLIGWSDVVIWQKNKRAPSLPIVWCSCILLIKISSLRLPVLRSECVPDIVLFLTNCCSSCRLLTSSSHVSHESWIYETTKKFHKILFFIFGLQNVFLC